MSKVTIISFIVVAICLNLQIVTAGLFNNPLLDNPLLKNAKDITNSLKNIAEKGQNAVEHIGNNALDIGKNLIPGLPGRNNGHSDKNNRNSTACNNLYDEIFTTLSEMAAAFYSCVLNSTESVRSDLQDLANSAKKLQNDLVREFRNASKCFQNPTNLIPCITKEGKNMGDLLPAFEQLLTSFYDILKTIPDLKRCYVTSHFQKAEHNFNDILQKLIPCFESIF
ncbi:hypothetical protein DMN91_001968 [Ooceraea biroi]|uniref:Uncharacterized protein n=1 Tax=Ooceraea biroi TaxID=2015173 RepID=A0A026WAH3_OOCBI|nr:uncharacterized protein LOC105281799 isoform X1 [Ooceraea biroi]EZA52631.1 hypothetical protein X777_08114 [Ooceraea biroi]RLU25808.1 hypothetical protein DMN91_001968 [Ooceraea biroi]